MNGLVLGTILGMGGGELAFLFAALFLLFGGSKLPQLGSALGTSIRNFKKGFSGEDEKPAQPKLEDGKAGPDSHQA